MLNFKIEAAHEGVMHKGIWKGWDSRFKTACGKTLAKGTYDENKSLLRGDADCPDCLNKR
jgi:hypothetical protein